MNPRKICQHCFQPKTNLTGQYCWNCYATQGEWHEKECIKCHGKFTGCKRNLCSECYELDCKQRHAELERQRRITKKDEYLAAEQKRNQTEKRIKWKQAYGLKYRQEHKEELREYYREYQRSDPERRDEKKRRRRARIHSLPATLTTDQWQELLDEHNHSCAYCHEPHPDKEFHREHKLPASRGGGYTKENIAPSCDRCNLRKGRMTDTEFREYLRQYPNQ